MGNIAWMTATAGMLYLETPQRLCVNYLQDDQQHTGIGLVLLAMGLGALAIRRVMQNEAQENSTPKSPVLSPHGRVTAGK